MRCSLHPRSILIYLFSAGILYLAAVYLAGPFAYLAAVVVIVGVLNLAYLVAVARALSVRPYMVQPRAVRDDAITTGFTLLNDAFFSVSGIRTALRISGPEDTGLVAGDFVLDETFTTTVRASHLTRVIRTAAIPHRGRYRIEGGPVRITDSLGWATLTLSLPDQYVEVLPRADAQTPHIADTGVQGGTEATAVSGSPDFAMLRRLSVYRDGMPARHIAWKRLASTGIPYVREYEPSADPHVAIYLDTRRGWADREALLASEDTLVEALLRLIRELQSKMTPFRCTTVEQGNFHADSTLALPVDELYSSSRNIRFEDGPRPLPRIRESLRSAAGHAAHVVVLTQMPDMDLFRCAGSSDAERHWTVIGVTEAWSAAQRAAVEAMVPGADPNSSGGSIRLL